MTRDNGGDVDTLAGLEKTAAVDSHNAGYVIGRGLYTEPALYHGCDARLLARLVGLRSADPREYHLANSNGLETVRRKTDGISHFLKVRVRTATVGVVDQRKSA